MKPELNNKPRIPYGWLRVILFVAVYLAILMLVGIVIALLLPQKPGSTAPTAGTGLVYLSFIINAVVSFAVVWLFRKIIDRKSFDSMGFEINKSGMHAGTGFFLGVFLLCTGTCILFFSKNLQWTNISFNGNDLFISFGLMVIVAFYEEIVFRGYILSNLLESVPKWGALLLSAFIFAIAHAANPDFSIVGAVNILLAGLLLGINYIYTRNLWFGIMLHFSWNFFQGPILGFDVSGLHLQSLLQHDVQGSDLLTGGKFGFEGSLVATVLLVMATAMLWWVYEKKYAPVAAAANGLGSA